MTSNSLDIFCHWAPPAYKAAALKASAQPQHMLERALSMPVMIDMDARLKLMDRFPGYRQAPCLVSPPLEALAGPQRAAELACIANDGMAEMAGGHPDRFPGFFASLAMNHPEAMLTEARRAVTELGACGVQIFTNINGASLDTPPVMDLFALMAELDRPILLHPALEMDAPDYTGERYSKYELWWALGWPYETSKAMYRLVFAGVFERWPNLKIITHHGGGMIPMVEGRLSAGLASYGTRTPPALHEKENTPLKGEPLAAFKHFYTDTATFGSSVSVECALKFFGHERLLFATDLPFGPEQGARHIKSALVVVNGLNVNQAEREGILRGNSERILFPGKGAPI
jgi:predicted TIM-barrel fold metal-dependent hydrolase